MLKLSDAYIQFLDKRWWIVLVGGGILVVIVVIAFLLFSGGSSAPRDSQRLKEVEYIGDALTKYYQAKGTYPAALKELIPTYAPKIPSGFSKPDGACKIGGYQYKKYVSINTFELLFCLGEPVGEYSAGNHILNPLGIK